MRRKREGVKIVKTKDRDKLMVVATSLMKIMEQPRTSGGGDFPILPEEKSHYFNGYQVGFGGGDVVVTLIRNGTPTITLNASFTTAKSFAIALSDTIGKLERCAEHQIMTIDQVDTARKVFDESK
ncbi:MAG TPA: hypothetical protein VIS96_16590 [Terrimicrobiaceae bacterium]